MGFEFIGGGCNGGAGWTDLARGHLWCWHAGRPLRHAGIIGPGSSAGLVDADVAAAGGSGSLQHVGTCREGPPEAAARGGVPRLGPASECHIALRPRMNSDHQDASERLVEYLLCSRESEEPLTIIAIVTTYRTVVDSDALRQMLR